MKVKLATMFVLILASIFSFAAEKPSVVKIWEGVKMPGSAPKDPEGFIVRNGKTTKNLSNVSSPTMEFFFAESDKPTSFVVVCPGGGYSVLAYEKEGINIAKLLQKNGISAGVLKYRVPSQFESALMDSQRAVRLVRANAKNWNVDPEKIGIMGFSAGANLSARTATNSDFKSYKPLDKIDSVSPEVNFVALIYPAWLDSYTFKRWFSGNKKNFDKDIPSDYSAQYRLADIAPVSKDSPKAFIVQSQNDRRYINSAIAYYLACKNAGVESEIHLYPTGGHGYGDGSSLKEDSTAKNWFGAYLGWLKLYNYAD